MKKLIFAALAATMSLHCMEGVQRKRKDEMILSVVDRQIFVSHITYGSGYIGSKKLEDSVGGLDRLRRLSGRHEQDTPAYDVLYRLFYRLPKK